MYRSIMYELDKDMSAYLGLPDPSTVDLVDVELSV